MPPLLVDRDAEPADALCGGFLSWQTVTQLADLGVDVTALGAHRIDTLRLFARGRMEELNLPAPARALSRRALDTALRARAIALGADFAVDTIRTVDGAMAAGHKRDWHGCVTLLANGKHDIRGNARPRTAADPALGLRIRLPRLKLRTRLIGRAIELHLFPGGYAGIVLQEDGTANVCMAVRKSVLIAAGANPVALLETLCSRYPPLGERLGADWRDVRVDTIGAVPYGYIASDTCEDLYRLGDQAAVIPSLAGEGIGIALASGCSVGEWIAEGTQGAPSFQRTFARRCKRPVRTAEFAWHMAEHGFGQRIALGTARRLPALLGHTMSATRI